jgi:PhoD-like phosphatase
MRRKSPRLTLGPIVGHTDHGSTRIWIQVQGDPAGYSLRIPGRGVFPFISTEGSEIEFGTAIAVADSLRPDRTYRYAVLANGHAVWGGSGSFRTMPEPGSMADVLFVSISCSDWRHDGAWRELEQFVEDQKPRFILMMGDQVYLDFGPKVELSWPTHLKSAPLKRRKAMAYRYRQHWQRDPIRRIMANVPTYMLWSDHEIRDGWGSWASDSPTLQAQFPKGAAIAAEYNTYFEDARKLYWHFQLCHSFAMPIADPYVSGTRRAIPVLFQCGRLAVLMLDDRGDRDLWREKDRALGTEQWTFIENELLPNLAPDIDALALVTQGPIVGMSATGEVQRRFGDRYDDVELFKRGDAKGLLELQNSPEISMAMAPDIAYVAVDRLLTKDLLPDNDFRLADFDDVRDQWSHSRSRPEQERLIRWAAKARSVNRPLGQPRGVIFLGGDIHTGALYEISVSDPEFTAPCLISSGIGQAKGAVVGIKLDDNLEVAPGIRAELKHVVGAYNFGVTHILFNGGTPVINNGLGHPGRSDVWSVRLV